MKGNLFCARSITEDGLATASIEEYMTMVAGGLAGATPHMISATVTAISRLVFEFKGITRTIFSFGPVLTWACRFYLAGNAVGDIRDSLSLRHLE